MKLKSILIAGLSIFIAIISIQNAESVELKFFGWEIYVSRILVVLISFICGLVIGILVSFRRKTVATDKKRIKEGESNKANENSLKIGEMKEIS